jgi:hypothetical protein
LIDLKQQFDEALGEWRVAHAGYGEARKIYERMLPRRWGWRGLLLRSGLGGKVPWDD